MAYLNLDDAVSGKHFKLSASPVLDEVLLAVAKELEYPEKGPVVCMTTGWPMVVESNLLGLGPIIQFTLTISEFPSGRFCWWKGDPVYHYHSNYDSYHWMKKFGDEGFVFHNLCAKYVLLLALQLSEREVIDFRLSSYSKSCRNITTPLFQPFPSRG